MEIKIKKFSQCLNLNIGKIIGFCEVITESVLGDELKEECFIFKNKNERFFINKKDLIDFLIDKKPLVPGSIYFDGETGFWTHKIIYF